MKRFLLAAALCLSSPAAWAQCVAVYPFTLTNGTVADANQVMANFNVVMGCASTNVNITGGTITGISSLHMTAAFPSALAALTNIGDINVGGYPSPGSEIPANVLQGLSVKVAVPTTFTEQPWPSTAVSGYITNGNTANANSTVVALFGFAGQTTGAGSPGTPFGLNVIAANCASVGCATGTGFANGNAIGGELDVNIMKIGAATPIGQAVGLFITGGSDVAPSNGAFGVRIKPLGAGVPWTDGFTTDNGAAVNGLMLGTEAASGASSSQPVIWTANNGSAVFMSATLDQSQNLQFLGTPDAGSIIALNVQARNAFKMGAPGSGINVLTSSSGTNTAVYGDLGTAALVLQNTAAQNVYRNTLHIFQNISGSTTYSELVAIGGAGSTSLQLQVNNNAGANLGTVTLGATDSGGTGFKVLRVPN